MCIVLVLITALIRIPVYKRQKVTLNNLSKKINLLKKNWWLIELTGKQELFVPEGIKENKI